MYNVTMKVKVCAKLNLSLNVGEKTGVFHSVDSVACTVDVFDVVEVVPRSDKKVTLKCRGVSKRGNSALKSAQKFVATFNTCGVDVTVTKGIPVGAGMGGSSADASAVIFAMKELFGITDEQKIATVCDFCGSDVAFLMRGGFARLTGRGEKVAPIESQPLTFVVTTFGKSLTKKVYARFDSLPKPQPTNNGLLADALAVGDVQKVNQNIGNMLANAVRVRKKANRYKIFCTKHGFTSNLTGSGSARYVVCQSESEAQKLCAMLCDNGFKSFVCHSTDKSIF